MLVSHLLKALCYAYCSYSALALAFNISSNSNYVSYYGQNSGRNQKPLGEYCQDTIEDVIVLSFMNGFPGVLMNFANACETTFPGSTLLHCPTIASDIKYCQSRGKAVILSMGGASGAYGFSSDAQGAEFADTVWDMFFKGSAAQRPFDDAVLDGIDLDIEGGSPTGYAAFINRLRTHYASDPTRKYYIAAAPQCPFPDAYVGSTLNSAWFDMVFVQFYNNYCGLNAYPGWFNFGDWDNWAKTQSINKDVRVFIGAPGSPSAASSGYIDGSTLGKIYKDMLAKHTSLGGIMTWDVSQSRTSGIANTIRSFLDASEVLTNATASQTTSVSSTRTVSSTTSSSAPIPSTSSSTSSSANTSSSGVLVSTTTVTATETITTVSTTASPQPTIITTVSLSTSYVTVVVTYTGSSQTTSANNSWALSLVTSPSTSPLQSSQSTSAAATPSSPSSAELQAPGNAVPVANGTASKCPAEGTPCKNLTQGCNQSGYALCIGEKWLVYQCSAGTSCYLLGNTAACDWAGSHPKDSCVTNAILKTQTGQMPSKSGIGRTNTRPVSVYTAQGISSRIEFIPLAVLPGKYTALVKIQTLINPYSRSWMLQFRMPAGQTLDHTGRGYVFTNGTTVAIISDKTKEVPSSMAISFEVSGRYTGEYRLPDLTTAKVSAY